MCTHTNECMYTVCVCVSLRRSKKVLEPRELEL